MWKFIQMSHSTEWVYDMTAGAFEIDTLHTLLWKIMSAHYLFFQFFYYSILVKEKRFLSGQMYVSLF